MNQRFKIMVILIFPLLFYFSPLDVLATEGKADLKEADAENIIEEQEEQQEIEDEELDLELDQDDEVVEEKDHQPQEDAELDLEEQDNELDDHQVEEKTEQSTEDLDTSEESVTDEAEETGDSDESDTEKTMMSLASVSPSSFGEGDNGPHVTELKQKLTKLGIGNYPANPSTVYGGSTTFNVSEFQRYYGLEVTGGANEETLRVLEANINSPYQNGERGNHITEMKKKLTILGIGNYPTNPSGNFGGSTEVNLRRFQQMYGLNENGIGDDITLAKLNDMIVPRDGVRGEHVVKLKQGLRKLGIGNYPANPSNFFGDSTTYNLSEFQRYYGLTVTGIAEEDTLTVLEENVNSPYQNGSKGNHVVELKRNLSRIGIGNYPNNPSGNYGGSTDVNVRRFQRYYGLNENGIADTITLAKIEEIINSPYQNGNSGKHVVELKKNLSRLGIGNYPSSPSNKFGGSTDVNVRAFQRYYGLNENGIADAITMAKMQEILNSPYQDGKRGSHVVTLKQNLSRLGIGNYPTNPSGNYGGSTDYNVRAFQRYYRLNENGIADDVTLAKIQEILQSPYRSGQRGNHVVELKNKLSRLGIGNYPISPSPNYGSSTEANVKVFQRLQGLNQSGIADEITLQRLEEAYQNRVIKIFIDPGHGGKDPGGQGFGLDEKDVVLDIALKTSNILLSTYNKVDVMLPRVDDTFIELKDRTNLANDWGADYLVSLHTNAWLGRGQGFESFIHNSRATNEARRRQNDIHNYLINRMNVVDRGKKTANFHMLRESNMPAILIEYMFIDNYEENQLLNDPSYRNYLAQITAEAIANSFNLEKK